MIIGERIHFVETDAGPRKVGVRMYMPTTDGPFWKCQYEIDWPEGTHASYGPGNDALHAIFLTQEKIATDLYMSRYHQARKMCWLKPWVGYGFPLPKDGRDLLIGTDKLFYG